MYDIEFYADKKGESEVYEYIQKLKLNINRKENRQKLKKIYLYIDLLAEYGFNLKEPYIKKLNGDIWELRVSKERILFASFHSNKFVLLNMFVKQTQKTPRAEIEKAKKLLLDYKERSKSSERI